MKEFIDWFISDSSNYIRCQEIKIFTHILWVNKLKFVDLGSKIFYCGHLLFNFNCWCGNLLYRSWSGILLCSLPFIKLIIILVISRNIISIDIKEVFLLVLTLYEPTWRFSILIIITSLLVFPANIYLCLCTLLGRRNKILLQFKVENPSFHRARFRYILGIFRHHALQTNDKIFRSETCIVCSWRVRY